MFDLLKKKISGFIGGFLKKEEEKPPEKIEETKEQPPKLELNSEPLRSTEEKPTKHIEKKVEPAKPPAVKKIEEKKEQHKKIEKEKIEIAKPIEPKLTVETKVKEPLPKKLIEPKLSTELLKEQPEEVAKEPIKEHKKPDKPLQPVDDGKSNQLGVKIGIVGQIKSIFTGEVDIAAQDVEPLLQTLELDLLEADVGIDVATEITKELEGRMIGRKIKKSELNLFVKNAIKETLVGIARNEKAFDLLERIKQNERPVRIMFIGPNGSGKTTTIAKVAKMLIDHGDKVVFGAADTFRAAAVEQIDIHGSRLGVKTIKRDYGSDPTAVAYDAVNYAKAHAIDVVLIDTAGRQDTNLNLINELKKMNRVIQPQLKIYIGESIAGNAIVEQVIKFHKEIGIDGIILTKLDCDPKGGTILSLSKITGIPIIYLGTGQSYADIERFDAEKMVEQILS